MTKWLVVSALIARLCSLDAFAADHAGVTAPALPAAMTAPMTPAWSPLANSLAQITNLAGDTLSPVVYHLEAAGHTSTALEAMTPAERAPIVEKAAQKAKEEVSAAAQVVIDRANALSQAQDDPALPDVDESAASIKQLAVYRGYLTPTQREDLAKAYHAIDARGLAIKEAKIDTLVSAAPKANEPEPSQADAAAPNAAAPAVASKPAVNQEKAADLARTLATLPAPGPGSEARKAIIAELATLTIDETSQELDDTVMAAFVGELNASGADAAYGDVVADAFASWATASANPNIKIQAVKALLSSPLPAAQAAPKAAAIALATNSKSFLEAAMNLLGAKFEAVSEADRPAYEAAGQSLMTAHAALAAATAPPEASASEPAGAEERGRMGRIGDFLAKHARAIKVAVILLAGGFAFMFAFPSQPVLSPVQQEEHKANAQGQDLYSDSEIENSEAIIDQWKQK